MTFTKGYIPWNKGIPQSEEHKKANSESHKGQRAWNKGIPPTEEHKKKNADAHKGNVPWNKGKVCPQISKVLKGRIITEAQKKKISESRKGKRAGKEHPRYGKTHTEEARKKISEAHKGKPAWCKGKKLSEEHCKRLSDAHIGQISWSKGKNLSKEHCENLSKAHMGQRAWNAGLKDVLSKEAKAKMSVAKIGKYVGEKNPHWTGGEKMATARMHARRKTFGFIPLNEWESKNNDFVAHHLDKEHVLYIPKDLHNSVRHKQENQESMDAMNIKVIDWYIDYYGLR